MISKTQLYNKLNHYFENDTALQEAIHFIQTGEFPNSIEQSPRAKSSYKRKFKDFIVRNNQLVFSPLNLTVLRKRDIDQVLSEEYQKKNIGLEDIFYLDLVLKKKQRIPEKLINL